MTDTWAPVQPLVDTPAQQQYWREPKIGDRVRVRLSGECRADWSSLPRSSTLGRVNWKGHVEEEDGLIGTMVLCPVRGCPLCNDGLLGHRFSVDFDELVRWRGRIWPGGHYAACELEILP